MPVIFFFVGLSFLLLGAVGVVNSAVAIAHKIRISPLVIGITAVALGTSLPEITVSFFGGIDKAPHLALGNIIGSNIANIGLILGASVLLDRIRVGTHKTQSNMIVYLLLSIVTSFILFTGNLTATVGLTAIGMGFVLLLWQVRGGMRGVIAEDKDLVRHMRKTHNNQFILFLLFIVSLAGLTIGGKLLVDNGVIMAAIFNIPQTVIGITIVAIGTSLPELAVSIIGLIKHEEKLVVGNILGSNIFNILFGGGILGLYSVGSFDNNFTLLFFLIFSLAFSAILYIFRGKVIPRYVGGLFFMLYIGYLVILLK